MNPNEPIRDARKLGTPKMLVLGLQHMFAMFGATILVPILVQQYGLPLDIQTTLFFAGIGTPVLPCVHQIQGCLPFWAPPLPSWAASAPWPI